MALLLGIYMYILSCLGSLVGKSVAWKVECHGFGVSWIRVPPEAADFSLKNDCFGRVVLCCFAFLLCCVCPASLFEVDCSCIYIAGDESYVHHPLKREPGNEVKAYPCIYQCLLADINSLPSLCVLSPPV